MRRMNPLFLLLALLVVLVPASAQAGLQIAGGRAQRERKETPPRKGMNVGASIRVGAAGMQGSFIPVVRGEYEISGGITDRFTLGVTLGGTGYLGIEKGSFNADLVARRFFGRGFFLRGSLGVMSHAPALGSDRMRPAVGGQLGMGYEFRVLEKLGLGLGVDYDGRLRNDGRPSQTLLIGLRFTGYLNKKL